MLQKTVVMVLFLACTGAALAEDVSVEASVAPDKISIRESAQLTVTVHGGKGENPPELPKINGLDTRYLGPSTSISIINGQYSSERSFIYNLFPTKTGRMQIPPLTVPVEGKDYTTKAVDLEVVAGEVDRNDANTAAPAAQDLKDRLFIALSAAKTRVYAGEKVPVNVKLMAAQVPLHNIQFPKIDKSGFGMDDFSQPQQYTQAVNGTKYNVIDFSTYIYPVTPGELTVGPAQIEGSILYRNPQQRRNPAGGSFFNDDFFNGFFDSYQEKPITASSETLKLEVMPLPEAGRPAGFSGAVGQLDFSASISPAEVRVGDPVTLRMKVSGSANFHSIQMPVFNDSRFKSYDPQIKNEGNALTLEQVIIPTDVSIAAVPALQFSYFEPISGAYKTLAQGPFDLKVTAPQPGQEFKALGFGELQTQPAPVDYVQKYIKRPLERSMAVLKTFQFWMGAAGLAILWGLWVLWSRFRARLASDKAFARRVNALKNARQGLAQAERSLNNGGAKEFYGILHKTLSGYVRDKGLKEENIPQLKAIYEACDLVRFAGGQAEPSRMRLHLEQAKQIVK